MRSSIAKTRKVLSIEDFLGNTSSLIIKADNDNNTEAFMPLYVTFQFQPVDSPGSLQTDEAEVFLAYGDGFGILGSCHSLPKEWQLSDPDNEGNAFYKVPASACVGSTHRRLRRRRYLNNVRVRMPITP